MSEPIRNHHGIIDKYIGDAIMAYWGPRLHRGGRPGRLLLPAALDMVAASVRYATELPELLGIRNMAIDCDIRIGIATGEVLIGSIGSELMMSFTVMGDR